jgi:hypothetical protein
MELTRKFYLYLAQESKDTEGLGFYPVFSEGLMPTLDFMWLRHQGFCIIFILLAVDLPARVVEEKFINLMEASLVKIKTV